LSADALKWERGGGRAFGRGHGRGKGRSPRPDAGPSQQPIDDTSEQEDNVDASTANGAVTAVDPADEPVLETLEERERFYQEVGPFAFTHHLRRLWKETVLLRAVARAPFVLARESP